MGNRFYRLRYSPPETFGEDDRIGHGEAVSMITDLLVSSEERYFLRRNVDNHLRYAVKKRGGLSRNSDGTYQFAVVAAWAAKKYGERNPGIHRMPYGVTVFVSGSEASSEVGAPSVLGGLEDYKISFTQHTDEIERLAYAFAEKCKEVEELRKDAEIGRTVREGSMKGGLAPKCL